MAHILQLEEFDLARPNMALNYDQSSGAVSSAPDTNAGPGLAAYEKGYEAGWDDASTASSQDQERITTEFSHNLQDLGFTFHEAKSHVIHSLRPLLSAMVDKLLPDLVAKTMGQRIIEELMPLAEQVADAPIKIVIAPGNHAALEPLLAGVSTCNFEICSEPSLAPGQVFLRSGKFEKRIDLEQALLKIGDAVLAVGQSNEEAFAHG